MSTNPVNNPVPTSSEGKELQFGDETFARAFQIPAPPMQPLPMREFRGNTLGQSFHMVERLKKSREYPMIGYWLGAFPYTGIARVVGQAGFDFVILDWEHTPFDNQNVGECIKWIQYASEGNTATIIRAPDHSHAAMAWVLDAGASAIILPHVETAEQAKTAVRNCRFPPAGQRSGPPNAFVFGFNDGAAGGGGALEAFHRAGVIMQIESEKGCLAAEEIAAVEGVNGLMVGPGDLAFDLGISMMESRSNPRWNECVKMVVDAAKKHNLACFMPGFFPTVDSMVSQGFTMTTVGNDGLGFAKHLRDCLTAGHAQLAEWKQKNVSK